MPKTLNVDWAAVKADRDAGIPVAQLIKKYGVSYPTIYAHTKGSGRKRAGGGQKRTPTEIAARGRLQWSCQRRRELPGSAFGFAQAA
jgi:hypothetical protein